LGNAIKAYETVAIEDPTGPLADDSLMALGNARFVNGQYEDAARYYDRLRKEYPNSPHQVQAHLLAIKSKEMIYQGPMYDVTPLEEAAEVADTALAQFGNQLGAERDKVAAMRGKIDAKLAERDWGMAQFYETKKQISARRGTTITRSSRSTRARKWPGRPRPGSNNSRTSLPSRPTGSSG
jgi:outer membrane protein assembly factor BamD (BamD/ComL family)